MAEPIGPERIIGLKMRLRKTLQTTQERVEDGNGGLDRGERLFLRDGSGYGLAGKAANDG
jgi:hypothetical protein